MVFVSVKAIQIAYKSDRKISLNLLDVIFVTAQFFPGKMSDYTGEFFSGG